MITNKNYTDFFYTNDTFAKAAKISLQEINDLEKEFLYHIDFNLQVDGQ